MSEPGTELGGERPKEWGAKLTADWWLKASDALLRRLVGFPHGDGPPEEQKERLCRAMQIVFDPETSGDFGEREVRRFLGAYEESTDALYVRLSDALTERCGPYVLRRAAQSTSQEEDAPPRASAAVRGPPSSSPPPGPPGSGTRGVRPRPTKPGAPFDWWQAWIDSQHAKFNDELEDRQTIYETYLHALDPRKRAEFAEDPAVVPNEILWRGRFDRAVACASMAKGKQPDPDDAYHCPPPRVRDDLRSTWLLGEMVHAAWQFQYLRDFPSSSVLAEYMFSAATLPGSSDRGVLTDYREIIPDEENPSWLGAAQWAYGNWRPDLLDFTKRRILEIKPVRTAPGAVLQLWRYTHNFNCARYFDELTKAGAQGTERYVIAPEAVPEDTFAPVDPTGFLEDYFAAEDERRRAGVRIPKRRRRARRSEVEGAIRKGRILTVVPLCCPALPGVVMYLVYDDRDRRGDQDRLPTPEAIRNLVYVVTGIIVVTAVLVAIVFTSGAAAPAAAAALPSATGAVIGGVGVAAVATTVDVFGTSVEAKQFAAASDRTADTLARLTAEGVL
jgi:hypothetical protein